jgi:hypothetical protein
LKNKTLGFHGRRCGNIRELYTIAENEVYTSREKSWSRPINKGQSSSQGN